MYTYIAEALLKCTETVSESRESETAGSRCHAAGYIDVLQFLKAEFTDDGRIRVKVVDEPSLSRPGRPTPLEKAWSSPNVIPFR